MKESDAYLRLVDCGIRPSMQRLSIMDYLLKHATHPTIDDIYKDLLPSIPTLSRTTLYNTLRLFAETNAAQLLTIDISATMETRRNMFTFYARNVDE